VRKKMLLAFFLVALGTQCLGKVYLPPALKQVGVSENLGTVIPLDLVFTDQTGAKKPLKAYFDGKKPCILTMVYYGCPMLCGTILNGLEVALKRVPLTQDRYQRLTVSFDPKDTVASAATFRPDANWPFLVGSESSIDRLSRTLGFKAVFLEETQEYAHPAVVFVLSPSGKIVRYLYGVQFNPFDLKMAILEASEGKVRSSVEKALLYCYDFSANANGYQLSAIRLMRFGGVMTLIFLIGLFFYLRRLENKRKKGQQ